MIKTLVKLLMGLVLLVIVIVAGLVITIANLDLNDYKDTIANKVAEETGRSLALEGDIRHSFYPWLGIEVDGLVVGNAAGFGDTPFLSTEALKVRVKLMPLLRKELEVDTIQIQGARLNLARNKDGVSNWDDLVKPGEEPQKKGEALPLAALVLGGVNIQNAAISWSDNTTGLTVNISDASLQTGELVIGEPIELVSSMKVAMNQPDIRSTINLKGTIAYDDSGKQFSISPFNINADLKSKNIPQGQGAVSLTTAINLDLEEGTAILADIIFKALKSQVTGDLRLDQLNSATPSPSATLDVAGEDVSMFFKVAEIEPLASQLAKLSDRKFNLKTTISTDMSRGDIDIASLTLNLLGANIQGEIHTRNSLSETPAVKGQIVAKGPDLTTLVRIASVLDGKKDSKLKAMAKQMQGSKDKSFDIKADFDADLKTGEINIETLHVKAIGLALNGNLKAKQFQSDTPALKGKLNAKGPDLPMLMAIAGALQEKDNALSVNAKKLSRLKKKSFELTTQFDVDMKSGRISLPALKANALGFDLSGKVSGDNINSPKGSMNGNLKLVSTKLKPVLSALDQADLAKVLKSFTVNTGVAGNLEQLRLKPLAFSARFSGKQIPNSPVDLKVSADTLLNVKDQILNLQQFSVSGLGLDIKGKLHAKQFIDNPTFNGELSIAPFDLRKFMKQLNQTLPPTADNKVLNKVALENTTFSGTRKSLVIKKFKAVLDDSRLQGNFNINDFDKSEYQFGIGIDKINADRYLPPKAQGKPATPETVAAGAATELPLETLRALNVKGDLLIGDFVISNAKLKDVQLSINAKNGDIKLVPIAAKLYDGTYKGAISLDAKGKYPRLIMNTDFANVNVESLLTDITGSANLKGIGNISLVLNSRGSDINVLRNTLSGNGKIDFRKGVLKGIDIQGVLQQVEVMYESKRIGKVKNGEETKFDSLTATLDIHSGVIDNNDLLMMAPGFKVNGKGMLLNLNDETWKYNFTVNVDEASATSGAEQYNLGGYSLGIKCRGKVVDKRCTPDVESILKAMLKNTLKDKIKGAIGDKLGIKIPGMSSGAPAGSQPAPQEQTAEPTAPAGQEQTKPKDPIKELQDKLFDKIF